MEKEATPHLFEIKLNEDGKNYILKFCSLILIIFLVSMAISAFSVYESFGYFMISSADAQGEGRMPVAWWASFSACLYILVNLINVVAMIFYLRFSSMLRRSIKTNDENLFNSSFRMVYLNAILSLAMLLLNLLLFLLPLFPQVFS